MSFVIYFYNQITYLVKGPPKYISLGPTWSQGRSGGHILLSVSHGCFHVLNLRIPSGVPEDGNSALALSTAGSPCTCDLFAESGAPVDSRISLYGFDLGLGAFHQLTTHSTKALSQFLLGTRKCHQRRTSQR